MQKWSKLSQEIAWDGYRKILFKKFQMPDGQEMTFETLPHSRAACILALTPDNRVILARQFRPGMEEVLLELPGGGVDKNEQPLQAAARELLEETGYAGELQAVGYHFKDAYQDAYTYDFVATNCRQVAEPTHENAHGEWIEIETLDLAAFRAHLRSGRLTDATTGYAGLDFLGLL